MCMHAFVYHVCAWPTEVKEGIGSPLELRLRDSSELPCEWYLNYTLYLPISISLETEFRSRNLYTKHLINGTISLVYNLSLPLLLSLPPSLQGLK